MKFSDYEYKRLAIDSISKEVEDIAKAIETSDDVTKIRTLIDKAQIIISNYSTMSFLCYIRNSIDTTDSYYESEMEYLDENGPIFSAAQTKYTKALVYSKYRLELEKVYGSHWFKMMEMPLKCFSDVIIDDVVIENKLVTKYDKLMASAKIEFDGKINTLPQMGKYATNPNREIRKAAAMKTQEFLLSIDAETDQIFDELVKVRTSMAKKMGYKDYVEFGYYRMNRLDYNSEMVETYRNQVLKSLVPLAIKIIEKQKSRIGIDDLKFYDLSLEFNDGNPTPKGDLKELVDKAAKMYSEMSAETKEFFDFMVSHELLDLESKPGKRGGGFCEYLPDFKSPFIFANFNGTQGDVDVLTHEAGHAFQVYSAAKNVKIPSLVWPTNEAAEIHSMSMEFFAYPWIDSFFGSDTNKYKYSHITGALTFIPYGVAVDEFQHYIYTNYNASIKERREKWQELERKYLPYRDYDSLKCYATGGFWHRQGHIFQVPFYYIDYTLAQVCALQFYLAALEDKKDAWDRYVKLCKLGGSKSFLELLEAVGLKNPFIDGSISEVVEKLMPIVDEIKI